MVEQSRYKISDVKPVTFERHFVSDDGERVIFEIHDKTGGIGHIAIDWLKLSLMVQVIARGAEQAATRRKELGKSDQFDGSKAIDAQVISGFQISDFPDRNLKLLSLTSPAGFRCDFAIPTDTEDQRGRLFPQAIAEELLAPPLEKQQRPN